MGEARRHVKKMRFGARCTKAVALKAAAADQDMTVMPKREFVRHRWACAAQSVRYIASSKNL